MKSSATPADLAATAGSSSSPSRRRPRLLATISRLLMGLMFFVFGLNGFLNLIPPPSDPMPEGAVAFATALGATGYMFPLVKGTEIVVGLLLLANRFVPLALVVLTPVLPRADWHPPDRGHRRPANPSRMGVPRCLPSAPHPSGSGAVKRSSFSSP
jgi:hypothetical protein